MVDFYDVNIDDLDIIECLAFLETVKKDKDNLRKRSTRSLELSAKQYGEHWEQYLENKYGNIVLVESELRDRIEELQNPDMKCGISVEYVTTT